MSWIDAVRERARMLLRTDEVERELQAEMSFHLEQETARVLAQNSDVKQATRNARITFGSVDRFSEEARDTWTGAALRGVREDARHGFRALRKQPVFTIVALATLALGIGANAAIFSLVRAVLLEPLPYHQPDRLVVLWNASRAHADDTWFSERELYEYRAAVPSFAALDGYTDVTVNLRGENEPERVRAGIVSPALFGTLGVAPARGRDFSASDATDERTAIISHALWQRHFGGALDVLGRTIETSGVTRRVIGVMPAGFQLPLDYRDDRPTELWYPMVPSTGEQPWGDRSYYLVGRLRGGVGSATATAEMDRAYDSWVSQQLINPLRIQRAAVPIDGLLLGNVRPALMILFAAVGVIFLIACVNVMHLLLARGDTRRAEIATQAALGASRWRITRRLLVETLLLSIAGAALGVFVAQAGLRALLVLVPANVIRTRDVSLDFSVLAFAAVLAIVATLVAGMAPALQLARVDLARSLAGVRGESRTMRRHLRHGLVVAETALALVLVIGATLLARSFAQQRSIDLGYDTNDALTFRVTLPSSEYSTDASVTQFFRTLQQEMEQMPRVTAVGGTRILPLAETIGDWSITVEHRDTLPGENPNGDWQVVTPNYFEAMGIDIVAGRSFTHADNENAPLVAVINESMAAKYWGGANAVGRRFHLGTAQQPWVEIVGIARTVRHNAVVEDPREEMYLLHSQWVEVTNGSLPRYSMTMIARTDGDPLALVPSVRALLRRLDAGVPLDEVRTLDAVAARALAQPRFTTTLLMLFAGLAFTLALIGLYGVIAFVASRRTHEMGLRIAIGARPGMVTALMMREGLTFALLGVLIGLPAAVLANRLLQSQLYGVSTLDPGTYIVAPLLFVAVAAVASYLPARRAGRVSPLTALRAE
jgi:putative ABC transport system permease protein